MVYFLLVVAVGGAGTIRGPLLAALVLGVADVAGKYYVPEIGAFVIYAMMVLLLVLFPAGLLWEAGHESIDGGQETAASVGGRRGAGAAPELPDGRWHPAEAVFWLLPVAAFFLLPDYLMLGGQVRSPACSRCRST